MDKRKKLYRKMQKIGFFLLSVVILLSILGIAGFSGTKTTYELYSSSLQKETPEEQIRNYKHIWERETEEGEEAEEEKEIMAITAFSKKDSCHYPTGDKCLTASGKVVADGMVACNKRYAFGTKFIIDGKEYICEDRYNEKLDLTRGYETVDIWMGYEEEDYLKAKNFGMCVKGVEIIK